MDATEWQDATVVRNDPGEAPVPIKDGPPAPPRPQGGWPGGTGYTHYKWRLDGGDWSAEQAIQTPITLSGLAPGSHHVEVIGKRDTGRYQNDPELGPAASITRSRDWVVAVQSPLKITAAAVENGSFVLQFPGEAGQAYTVQYKDSLDDVAWSTAAEIPKLASTGLQEVKDLVNGRAGRFYRVVTSAQR